MTGRPVRSLAFFGYLGSGNIGNDASLETVLGWIRERHPEVALRCITVEPDGARRRHGLPSAPLSFRPRSVGPLRQSGLLKLVGRLGDIPRSLRLAGSVDAVLVPGMGVLEETLGVRPWGMPFWLFLMAGSCRLRRRPFVLLDIGAERAADPLTRLLNSGTVRLAGWVSYRDRESAEVVRRARHAVGPVTPDLAFAHPATARSAPEPGLVAVGVMAFYGPSDDPVSGGAVHRRYLGALARALVAQVDGGARLLLLGGDRVDVDVARELEKLVRTARPDLADDAVEVSEAATFTELTDQLARAEVVVASRFHNVICALRLARPTIAIGYAGKSRSLMQAVGSDRFCQDIDSLDAELLERQLQQARAGAAELSATVRERTTHYAAEVRSLMEQVGSEALGLSRGRS